LAPPDLKEVDTLLELQSLVDPTSLAISAYAESTIAFVFTISQVILRTVSTAISPGDEGASRESLSVDG
jgi:hypothetical protein